MLEKCNHEQRTVIVETVAPELVKIALNMHGTRAVQKLIEYLSTPQQYDNVRILYLLIIACLGSYTAKY